MSDESININQVIKETREILANPKEYFFSMPLSGGYTEPVIKAAVYGVVAGIFSLIWSLLNLAPMGAGGMWEGAFGIMSLIWSIVGAIVAVFIGGAIILVISAICGGNTNYETNVRVAASLMVLFPINAFLSFLYGISTTLGELTGLAISLWSVYLVYLAAIMALKGKESTAKIVAVVLLVLSLLGFWGGNQANRNFDEFKDNYQFEQLD